MKRSTCLVEEYNKVQIFGYKVCEEGLSFLISFVIHSNNLVFLKFWSMFIYAQLTNRQTRLSAEIFFRLFLDIPSNCLKLKADILLNGFYSRLTKL